ncbi:MULTISPECIES: helix-turn-helix domain-containing protein [unclassified Spirosoma]|uniref:helix-turn-helix domain-containing protein n=1 Tax=unclassified Spirosoma TaxID=2621999 RepID=UPI00095C79A8|nr:MULTISPECIES: helix-turn-helix domain-containing protein [unclassified Spirosoma]MBN8821316.1 helix-turn-helix domain-containing protein [Spirosoma sp.]OJW78104.1 MAG: hypothetical protein BGO59_29230 [Spirosoma sp. 48-14]
MTNPFDELQAQLNRMEGLVNHLIGLVQAFQSASAVDENLPLDVEGAAKVLGIAPGTVYQNISQIPHQKRHGRLYFYKPELLAYLNSGSPVDVSTVLHSTRKKKAKAM